jgi:hypothetical protein
LLQILIAPASDSSARQISEKPAASGFALGMNAEAARLGAALLP